MVAHNLVSKLAAIIDRCDLLNERTNQSAEFPMGVVFLWNSPVLFSLSSAGSCGRRVNLETSKTDEDGQAVHEECYVRKIAASVSLSRKNQSKALNYAKTVERCRFSAIRARFRAAVGRWDGVFRRSHCAGESGASIMHQSTSKTGRTVTAQARPFSVAVLPVVSGLEFWLLSP